MTLHLISALTLCLSFPLLYYSLPIHSLSNFFAPVNTVSIPSQLQEFQFFAFHCHISSLLLNSIAVSFSSSSWPFKECLGFSIGLHCTTICLRAIPCLRSSANFFASPILYKTILFPSLFVTNLVYS